MILATPRLTIREMDPVDDAEFICELLNSEGFLKYIGDRGVRTPEEASDFIETRYRQSYRDHGYGLYTVELKNNSEFQIPNSQLGICGFVKRDTLPHPDLGFAFLPQSSGNGYAFEAAEGCLKFGTDKLGFTEVLAIATQDNSRSHALLFKLGFKDAGLTKQPHDENKLKLFRIDLR